MHLLQSLLTHQGVEADTAQEVEADTAQAVMAGSDQEVAAVTKTLKGLVEEEDFPLQGEGLCVLMLVTVVCNPSLVEGVEYSWEIPVSLGVEYSSVESQP